MAGGGGVGDGGGSGGVGKGCRIILDLNCIIHGIPNKLKSE